MHILLVDDHMVHTSVLDRMLKEQGNTTRCITCTEEAIHLIHNEPFDAVITDVETPTSKASRGNTGLDIIRQIWAHDYKIPVLIHSNMRFFRKDLTAELSRVQTAYNFVTFRRKNPRFDYIASFLKSLNK
jgi:DNA-binding NarL/FixJ family response regulator